MKWPELPQYRSHKIVRAARVVTLHGASPDGTSEDVELEMPSGQRYIVSIDATVFARGRPDAGDFIVVYDDDYVSWSPKAAFEDGYTAAGAGHVFAGQPDDRQSADPLMPTSRFRPRYRALDDDERLIHDDIKDAFIAVEEQVERVKPGRYRALALTALEEACMWAIKGLTE